MVRPNRNISSESSSSSKASVDHVEKELTAVDLKETDESINKKGQDDNTGSPLSSVMGVKLDPNQMVILSGDFLIRILDLFKSVRDICSPRIFVPLRHLFHRCLEETALFVLLPKLM